MPFFLVHFFEGLILLYILDLAEVLETKTSDRSVTRREFGQVSAKIGITGRCVTRMIEFGVVSA